MWWKNITGCFINMQEGIFSFGWSFGAADCTFSNSTACEQASTHVKENSRCCESLGYTIKQQLDYYVVVQNVTCRTHTLLSPSSSCCAMNSQAQIQPQPSVLTTGQRMEPTHSLAPASASWCYRDHEACRQSHPAAWNTTVSLCRQLRLRATLLYLHYIVWANKIKIFTDSTLQWTCFICWRSSVTSPYPHLAFLRTFPLQHKIHPQQVINKKSSGCLVQKPAHFRIFFKNFRRIFNSKNTFNIIV